MQRHLEAAIDPRSGVVLDPSAGLGDGALAVRHPDLRHQLAQRWLLSFRRENTRAAYRRDVEAFFAWLDEFAEQLGADIWSVGRFHMDAYATFLEGEQETRYHGRRSYSPATIARKLTAVASFYRYCVDEVPHLVPTNPVAKVQRPEVSDDSDTAALSLSDARAFLDASRRIGLLEHALVSLLLTTGMRISEAVKADTGDLGDERGQRILWVTRKGGKRAKLVVPPEAATAVRRYTRGRRGPLFLGRESGQRIHRQQVDRVLTAVARRAWGKDHQKVTPHMLRHTAATLALDAGRDIVEVQEMLGHRDIKTTRRYVHGRDQLDNSAVHTVAALLGADVEHEEVE